MTLYGEEESLGVTTREIEKKNYRIEFEIFLVNIH